MRLQDEIIRRQNQPDLLKCQYVSRHFYNAAEKSGRVAFILALISGIINLLPNTASGTWNSISWAAPIIIDLFIFIFYYIMSEQIRKASMIRNYFDAIVLEFDELIEQNSVNDIRRIVTEVSRKRPEECKTQISNTGKDVPPGVKDWYTFSKNYADEDAVFECQKQNQWWNNKLMKLRLSIVAILFIIGIALFVIAGVFFISSPFKTLIGGLGFLAVFIDSIIENRKYIDISHKIDNSFELLENEKTRRQIIHLQKLIAHRRELRVVEFNFLHKLTNKQNTNEYEEESKTLP